MLSCREIAERATEASEGSLPLWTRLLFALHVRMCRHCAELVRQLELTAAALRAGAIHPPAGRAGHEALAAAFAAEFRPPETSGTR